MTTIEHIYEAIKHIKQAKVESEVDGLDEALSILKSTLTKTGTYINHSGGAIGSDYEWGRQGERYDVVSRHYWHGKKTVYGNVEIDEEEFQEGKKHVLKANEVLHRKPDNFMDLLARNYTQVKYSDAIYAIAEGMEHGIVNGGTGWAVQMAIDDGKEVYVFDQNNKQWYHNKKGNWSYCSTPKLSINFAGIGTRNINKNGIQAIAEVYRNTFGY